MFVRDLQLDFQQGRIPFTACQADPRFSYCLYVPTIQRVQPDSPLPLVVVIHGSSRTAESFRDQFIEFAEHNSALILVPLFPVGIPHAGEGDGYKLEQPDEVRYERLLLDMVDEVAAQYCVHARFSLYGFSGGAQFAHRFFYLYPECLQALSVAAPGQITLPDSVRPWGRGTADMERLFGRRLNLAAMSNVAVQLVVGAEDNEPLPDADSLHIRSRLARVESLYNAFCALALNVEMRVVPGIGHHGFALLPVSQQFLSKQLQQGDYSEGVCEP